MGCVSSTEHATLQQKCTELEASLQASATAAADNATQLKTANGSLTEAEAALASSRAERQEIEQARLAQIATLSAERAVFEKELAQKEAVRDKLAKMLQKETDVARKLTQDAEAAALKFALDAENAAAAAKLEAATTKAAQEATIAALTAEAQALRDSHEHAAAALTAKAEAAQQELTLERDALRTRVTECSSELEATKSALAAAQRQIDEAAGQSGNVGELLRVANEALADKTAECAKLTASVAELTANHATLSDKLKLKQQQCDVLDMDVSRMQVDVAEATRRADDLQEMVDSLSAKNAELERARMNMSAQLAKAVLGNR